MRYATQEKNTHRLITASLAIMGITMVLCSRDFSMSGDEVSQMQIGRNIYVYLGRTFGLLRGSTDHIKLDNYSGLFGVLSTGLAYWIPWVDEIYLRHFLIAITGFATIVYAGKTARLVHGSTAQLITIWMLFCSPRFFGSSMNNSKDIPFALGMMMTAYFLIRIIRAGPVIVRQHFAGLTTALFIAIGVRINGIVFCGLYGLVVLCALAWKWRRAPGSYGVRLAGWLTVSGLVAFLGAIIFLPRVWPNIPLNTLKALHNFSNYHVAITMLYNGSNIPTSEPPWHYLPVWIGITVPLVVLLFLLLSPLLLLKSDKRPIGLLMLMVLFPLAGTVAAHSPVYDGWRQFYFIYPPLVVLAGMAAAEVLTLHRDAWYRRAIAGLLIINLILPVAWSVFNHPLENVYFNELIGGVDGAFGRFETDYYGESVATATQKLLKYTKAYPSKDSLRVLSNVPTQINYYLGKADPTILRIHTGPDWSGIKQWDYGVFYTRGLDSLPVRKDWPPVGMIDSVVADHTVLMAIVKNPDVAPSR